MRVVPYVAVALVLGACAAFSAESDGNKPPGARDAGGAGEAGLAGEAGSVGDAGPGVTDGAAPDGASLDSGGAGLPLIDCFGTMRAAFYCDGFEGATLATPPWSVFVSSVDTNVTEFDTSPNQHLMGARSADAFVGPGVMSKTAKAQWQRPTGPGPLALLLHVYLPSDAWANGDSMSIAALVSSSARLDRVFTANGTGSNGSLSIKTAGPVSVDGFIGSVNENTWTCVEITANGTFVTGTKSAGTKNMLGNPLEPTSAELGISTSLAGKVFYYDNVILGPAAVGCP